jgi:branched-chain amino acid transport system substrate-binding protein
MLPENKPRAIRAISLLTALFIGACMFCASTVSAESKKETIKVGGIFSVTGPASFLGDPERKSMQLAVDMINSNGGVDGHMLEAIIYDSEGDPSRAVMNVRRLITRDNVTAIIGPSLTPTSLAVIPVVERAELPLISCAAGNQITEPIKPWVFKTAQSDIHAVSSIYNHMRQKEITKVAIMIQSDSFGESGRDQLLKQAGDFGIEVVAQENFGIRDTDTTAQLTNIRRANPEAIICWGTNPGPAVVARNIQQLGMGIPLYNSHGVASPRFIELAGNSAEGILLPTGRILVADLLPDSDPQKQVLKDYIKAYEERYNETASSFGGYAFDGINIFAEALKGTGGDKKQIRDNLEKITGHVGISGEFNFSETDHNGLAPDAFVMVRIKDGQWTLAE